MISMKTQWLEWITKKLIGIWLLGFKKVKLKLSVLINWMMPGCFSGLVRVEVSVQIDKRRNIGTERANKSKK